MQMAADEVNVHKTQKYSRVPVSHYYNKHAKMERCPAPLHITPLFSIHRVTSITYYVRLLSHEGLLNHDKTPAEVRIIAMMKRKDDGVGGEILTRGRASAFDFKISLRY